MTRKLLPAGAAVAAALLVLVMGTVPARGDPPPNPFAGRWSGEFSTSTGAVGFVEWTISSVGDLDGVVLSTPFDVIGTMVGRMGNDGEIHLVGTPSAIGFDAEPHAGFGYIDEQGQRRCNRRSRTMRGDVTGGACAAGAHMNGAGRRGAGIERLAPPA